MFVNHVLGIQRTSCTRADSESVSDCSITIWSGVAGIGSSTSSNICGPIGICNSWATSSLTPAVDKGATNIPNSLPCATVFACVSSGSCQERTVHQCLHEEHPSTPAERDNQETEFVSELYTLGKSTRIIRPSGSLHVTSRPPSCWSRAQLAVWIAGSGNGIFCPGYVIGQAWSWLRHCQEANTLHQLVSLWKTRNWLSHRWSTVPRLNCTRVLQLYSVFVKDTTRLKLFQKADSFPHAFAFPSGVLPFCVLLLLPVELSYAPPPGLQQSFAQCPLLPQFWHVLMSVELMLVVLVVRFPF